MKIVTVVFCAFFSINAFAASTLVAGAEITKISNSGNGSDDDFYVYVTGGTGPCAGQSILFPRSTTVSESFHNRAFSIALTAYTTGSNKVTITGFNGNDCTKAKMIQLEK